MGGHLFVVAGDVTRVHCDAWLLPTDDWFTAGAADFGRAIEIARSVMGELRWPDGTTRVMPVPAPDGRAQVWLGRVGLDEAEPDWFAD